MGWFFADTTGESDLGPGANWTAHDGRETGVALGRDGIEYNWRSLLYSDVPRFSRPDDPRVTNTDFGVDSGLSAAGKVGGVAALAGGGYLLWGVMTAAAAPLVLNLVNRWTKSRGKE